MKVRGNFLKCLMIGAAFSLMSCGGSDDDTEIGNWVDRSVFDGTPRSSAAAFVIGDYGYMGTGYDGDDYLRDFWQYDSNADVWTQKANFPGVARSSAVGFSIGTTGYVGTGYDGTSELGDFYAYDQASNTWSPISSITKINEDNEEEIVVKRGAIGFGVSGYGYFGTGNDGDNDTKDFWKYDPSGDTWTSVGFSGSKRRDATTFTIGNNVYVGTGDSNGIKEDDFWVFNGDTEEWTKLLDLDDDDDYNVMRANAVGFAIGGKGYIACGEFASTLSSVWEYDPAKDEWDETTAFEGSIRQNPIAFTFNDGARAFVGLGRSGSLYLDDFDEFFPDEEYEEED